MKKKLTLALLTIGIGLAGVATTTQAQTNLSFLTSPAALRAYGVEKATRAYTYLSCQSMVGNPLWIYTDIPTNHTSADILNVYDGKVLSISVFNPEDTVYGGGTVCDKDGNCLFYGYFYQQPVAVPGKPGWVLPTMPLVLKMNPSIAVTFDKNISSVQMFYVDPITGQTYDYEWLNSYGNKIWFPIDAAGQGFLVVKFIDGTSVNYNLANNGEQITSIPLTQKIGPASIENLLSYTNPTSVVDQLYSKNRVGANRTYEVIMTSGPKNTIFSVSTTEGYYPIGAWIIAGSNNWTYVQRDVNSTYISVPLTNTSCVIMEWNPSQFREPSPSTSYGAPSTPGSIEIAD